MRRTLVKKKRNAQMFTMRRINEDINRIIPENGCVPIDKPYF